MTALRGRFQEEYYAHCHWNFLLAPPGDRVCAGISVLPHPEAEDLEGPAPGAFVGIVGVGRWNMWTSEEVSPVTQLILFPGLPGIFLLVGCYLGWRLWKWFWRPRVIKGP